VPHTLVGEQVRAQWDGHLVRIYTLGIDGERRLLAVHLRVQPGSYSTKPEHRPLHRPARQAAYEAILLGKAEHIGPHALAWAQAVVVERGLRIGAAAADDFRSLVAIGLALVIGVQAFIIAAGDLKVLPLTGVTLPFISYGGSSLLANALVVGLLLALSDKGVEAPPAPRVGSRWRRRGRRATA